MFAGTAASEDTDITVTITDPATAPDKDLTDDSDTTVEVTIEEGETAGEEDVDLDALDDAVRTR